MAIADIRYHFSKMNCWLSARQVIVGGGLVFAAGVLIGSACAMAPRPRRMRAP